jgi:NAD(P)-dependent dehydrogenase (short-subunit alcohol dehydrogenase family)
MLTFKFDFSGKVVILTGGGSGIGRATALAFASSGAIVVVADVDDKRSIETMHQLQELIPMKVSTKLEKIEKRRRSGLSVFNKKSVKSKESGILREARLLNLTLKEINELSELIPPDQQKWNNQPNVQKERVENLSKIF